MYIGRAKAPTVKSAIARLIRKYPPNCRGSFFCKNTAMVRALPVMVTAATRPYIIHHETT